MLVKDSATRPGRKGSGARAKESALSIQGVNARVQELFRLTGMTTVLPIV
jgi:hypothetical protein